MLNCTCKETKLPSDSVPVRITVGPKNLANGMVELSTRDKSVQKLVAKEDILDEARALVKELYGRINSRVRSR